MNARVWVPLVVITGALGAFWLYSNRTPATPQGATAEAGKAAAGPGVGMTVDRKVQTPPDATSATPARTNPEEPAKDLSTEPVEALLELNYAVAGGSSAASTDEVSGPIDELLNGKHAGKTKVQLERYFRSIDVVLLSQRGEVAKDKVLSPEVISAFEIERAWLKDRLHN